MRWLMRALPAVAAAVLSAGPAAAQVGGQPFEFASGAGIFKFDLRANAKTGPSYVGSLGWRSQSWLALEGHAAFAPSESDTSPGLDHKFTGFGADLRWNLRPAESRTVPFVITGAGYGLSRALGHAPEKLERGAASLGFGVLFNVVNPRTYVRVQVRDVMFRERDAREFSHHLAATAGIHVVVGGRYRDQDVDGVRDWLDRCADTPIGCTVDAHGCPSDADGDGVCDGVDRCPDTPTGCTVSTEGCPADADGDGLCDGLDRCDDTTEGCTVDAGGCQSDTDGDGVCDGIDQCAGTPEGCRVDAVGCTQDTDGDGVCDALDRCPHTPAGIAVGPGGCPSEIGALERGLLVTGVARLRDITFTPDGKQVAGAARARLDSLGLVLQQYPELKIEIGGPTDVTGERAVRERLSLDEARAVTDYLQEKFPLIDVGQFTMRGYDGPAPGAGEGGPMPRRRVEFKVVNPEMLAGERQKRGVPEPEE